ncbi:MAG: MBL fold metallo-hydrolase [Eubacteriales bacterium]
MKIKFIGASLSVTGSCHLITTDKYKILLDCGQYQGSKSMNALNYEGLGFETSEIDFMFLSHAHIDHSGRIPLLVKRGYTGPIYCTVATKDLLSIMLKDSGYIHEKEAEWDNKKALRTGKKPVEPLYTVEDADESMKNIKSVLYGQIITINEDIKVRYNDAGHILGSSIIELWITEKDKVYKIVFSGDLGVKGRPILKDPTIIEEADFLIMETTYGDRLHDSNTKSIEALIDAILKTTRRGGTVVIPSFAVGRTQEIIYQLHRFYEAHAEHQAELDKIMAYVDSPLATSATEIFRRNAQDFDDETREYILRGDNPLDFKNLKFTRSSEESKALNFNTDPKIIISASGMCEAGRIKHHLKHNLWNPKSSVIFVGYQAEGTLGRSIVNGDKDVTVLGEKIHVSAEIFNLEGFSGHADRDDLLEWLKGFKKKPKSIFLVHGESGSKQGFADFVKEKLGYDCICIEGVSEFDLSSDDIASTQEILEKPINTVHLLEIKDRIAKVHEELEGILYNTRLFVDEKIANERMVDISNIMLELEKNTMGLASEISLEKKEEAIAEK